MHQKTFDRLSQQEKAANHDSMMALAKQVGMRELERFGVVVHQIFMPADPVIAF